MFKYILSILLLGTLLSAAPSSFKEYAERINFIEKVQRKTKDKNSWLQLEYQRVQLLQRSIKALDQILEAKEDGDSDPKHPWLTKHKKEIVYFSSAGVHGIYTDLIWKHIDQNIKAPSADQFGWFLSKIIPTFETEGDLDLDLTRIKETTGAYLKRFPKGKYHQKAIKIVHNNLKEIIENSDVEDLDKEQKSDATDTLKQLLKIVQKSDPKIAKPTIKLIKQFIKSLQK